jgi:hypothetical protein
VSALIAVSLADAHGLHQAAAWPGAINGDRWDHPGTYLLRINTIGARHESCEVPSMLAVSSLWHRGAVRRARAAGGLPTSLVLDTPWPVALIDRALTGVRRV